MDEKLRKIRDIFSDILDDENLEIDENFSTSSCPDWDSVVTVQLVMALEHEFGVKFTTGEVANLKSVADILKKLP